jgi:hypothetical protein
MDALPQLLATLIVAAAVVAVALPFLRRPAGSSPLAPHAPQQLELIERRDRALAALSELEFDHRTGKISDLDYQGLLRPLRREAVSALRLLDDAHEDAPRPAATANPRRRAEPQGTKTPR